MNRGVPPTEENARTGEFTPPGITAHASANRFAETSVLDMATSVPASPKASTTGCRRPANPHTLQLVGRSEPPTGSVVIRQPAKHTCPTPRTTAGPGQDEPEPGPMWVPCTGSVW